MARKRMEAQRQQRPESQTWREPTTVVAIEWDYYNSPVVDKSPGVDGVKELHPEELGLSAYLSNRLMSWMYRYSGPMTIRSLAWPARN